MIRSVLTFKPLDSIVILITLTYAPLSAASKLDIEKYFFIEFTSKG